MGTKLAGFHPRGVFLSADIDQPVESAFSLRRRRGGTEARPHPTGCVGRQGELADQQQSATGITQGPVHLSSLIAKHTVTKQAIGHPLDLGLGVARFHAHQGQQTGADLADDRPLDTDAGFADALDQDKHGQGTATEGGLP